jgi:hypothetical protein
MLVKFGRVGGVGGLGVAFETLNPGPRLALAKQRPGREILPPDQVRGQDDGDSGSSPE